MSINDSTLYYKCNTSKLVLSTIYAPLCFTINSLLCTLTEQKIPIKVSADEYIDKLTDHCICRISCMAMVKETRQAFAGLEELRLRKPHLTLTVGSRGYSQFQCLDTSASLVELRRTFTCHM